MVEIIKEKIKSVEQLSDFNDEYVYDIEMEDQNNPYFFGNDILLHNSAYFTVAPIKDQLKESGFDLNKNTFVALCDAVADGVNESFADFLKEKFNVPLENGEVIKCGREICATRGLWIKKKRYACLYYDKDGKRVDTSEKTGKLKLMGIETQRSDTPEWVQEKLEEMLYITLDKNSEEETLTFIKQMRRDFEKLSDWMKGTPKRVNNLTYYFKVYASGGKGADGKTITVPGHVRASINWNRVREINNDNASMKISDGQKVIVCKLRPDNPYGMSSIAFPIDQNPLPSWFTSLPFDNSGMVETIIDKKVENIIGVLGWNLSKTKESEAFQSLFSWD